MSDVSLRDILDLQRALGDTARDMTEKLGDHAKNTAELRVFGEGLEKEVRAAMKQMRQQQADNDNAIRALLDRVGHLEGRTQENDVGRSGTQVNVDASRDKVDTGGGSIENVGETINQEKS